MFIYCRVQSSTDWHSICQIFIIILRYFSLEILSQQTKGNSYIFHCESFSQVLISFYNIRKMCCLSRWELCSLSQCQYLSHKINIPGMQTFIFIYTQDKLCLRDVLFTIMSNEQIFHNKSTGHFDTRYLYQIVHNLF